MAGPNYAPLISEWASLTTANPGWTTAQKLNAVQALPPVQGGIPTLFPTTGLAIMQCLNWAEFATLTAPQQTQILAVCAMPAVQSGSASFLAGMFVAFYAGKLTGPTIVALTALAQATAQPWWQANGFTSQINANDLVAAGNLT